MKELWILRHAKSSWKDATLQDLDRPLKGRGRRNAQTIGGYLQQQQLVPDAVLCSPALRTCQTLEHVTAVCKWPRGIVNFEPRVYEASMTTLRQILDSFLAAHQRTLLVGHNPGLEALLLSLIGDCPRFPDGKLLPTGSFAQVRLNESEAPHQLLRLIQPRALDPATFEVIDQTRTFSVLAS